VTYLILKPEDVAKSSDPARAFAHYARQRLGVPGITIKDITLTKKRAREFFTENPQCDWYTLCRVVCWCKTRRKRPPRLHSLFALIPYAWADGAIPELDADRVDLAVEEGITEALQRETDPTWRRRLMVGQGQTARAQALEDWGRAHDRSGNPAQVG
jgi:hypothetical protein